MSLPCKLSHTEHILVVLHFYCTTCISHIVCALEIMQEEIDNLSWQDNSRIKIHLTLWLTVAYFTIEVEQIQCGAVS